MPTVWPTLDAPSANNFRDHFASSLDATKWASVVSGTGAVTVTDSYVQCDAPANSAAFIYYKTKLDKTKSQLWRFCLDVEATPADYPFPAISVINKSGAPTADTFANIQFSERIQWHFANPTGGLGSIFFHNNAVPTNQWWDTPSATWSTFGAARVSVQPIRVSDYYIVGLEIDAANQRWRLMQWCCTYVAGYTFDQGWRLFALTDWVTWANTFAPTDDLWLLFGRQYTDNASARTFRCEWVDYCEQNGTTLYEAWTAVKNAVGGAGHSIRHVWSYDGKTFIPEDRATNALVPTVGFESQDLQAPNVVRDGVGTDWLVYWGWDGGVGGSVGIAKAASTGTSPQNGPWTRGASNPIISPAAGETRIRYPFLFMDNAETDATKRWKIIAGVLRTSDNLEICKLWTSPGPPDTGTWTARGTIIDNGGVGSKDANGLLGGGKLAVIYSGGQYDVWYNGLDAGGTYHLLHATGASLTALAKDTNEFWPAATGTATLTANLTGRTATVDTTVGFAQDQMVLLDQDANLDNYSTTRVRKVVDGTHLELYHSTDGFTTVTPAKIRRIDAGPSQGGLSMVRATLANGGFEWRAYIVSWDTARGLGASYGALCEQNVVITHSAASPSGASFGMDQFYSPVTSRGFNTDLRSVENMGFLLGPLTVDAGTSRATPRSRGTRR